MIMKEIDSKDSAIEELETLLKENITDFQKKNIQSEISLLKKGHAGEKQAAYYINQLYEKAYVAHDLRLDVDGEIAQIDHMMINKFGFVILFETKNFSTDVKIDSEGVFHYYDYKKKQFRPFPSPIEQSKRHENTLRKAFEQINFIPIGIEHLVIFDHKAKIIKPKKGFDNVCYPDMIKKTHKKLVDNAENFNILLGFGNLIRRSIKTDSLSPEDTMRQLIENFHKPYKNNYKAKFSIQQVESTPTTSVEPKTTSITTESKYDMLTLAKTAKALGIRTKQLEEIMIQKMFMSRHEKGYLTLSKSGKEAGILLRKGSGGFYFLIPIKMLEILQEPVN